VDIFVSKLFFICQVYNKENESPNILNSIIFHDRNINNKRYFDFKSLIKLEIFSKFREKGRKSVFPLPALQLFVRYVSSQHWGWT